MRILAISKRVLKELLRDKRTLALIFIAPLVVLALLSYVFNVNTTNNATVGTVGVERVVRTTLDDNNHVSVKTYKNDTTAKKALTDEKVDAIIENKAGDLYVTYANTDVGKTNVTKAALQSALTKNKMTQLAKAVKTMQEKLPAGRQVIQSSMSSPTIHNSYNYGDGNSTFFDKMMPIMIGFFIFLFVFLISGMALLKERTSGTLDRLLATPVKRSDIVFAYLISYGIVAIVQTLLIVGFSVTLLHVEVAGSIWLVMLTTILIALVALSFGIFVSTFAKSEFQMMQFMPIVVIPQLFFSGLISLSAMGTWAQWLASILPLKYGASALNTVILNGGDFNNILGNLVALVVFIVILSVGNIIGLKRYRKV